MERLLELSLAASICWEILRYFSPWALPVRFAPAVVAAIAYGLTYVHQENIILGLAATGGVAVFNRITGAHERAPDQLRIPVPKSRRRTEHIIPPSRRIPGL